MVAALDLESSVLETCGFESHQAYVIECPSTRIGIWTALKKRGLWVRPPPGARMNLALLSQLVEERHLKRLQSRFEPEEGHRPDIPLSLLDSELWCRDSNVRRGGRQRKPILLVEEYGAEVQL